MRKTISTFADLQLHKNSQKKFLFEVDPAQIIDDWTEIGGGLYSMPWPGGLYSDTDFLTLKQNGVELTRVETLAECVATENSCFLDGLFPVHTFANLKAYYKFDNGALTTDSSGNSHTLTDISVPVATTGQFGGGVLLGADDAYSASNHADFQPAGSFSIIAWIKKSGAADYGCIFSSWAWASSKIAGIRMYHDITTGYVRLQSGRNTGEVAGTHYQQVISGASVCDGNWHFVVGTWDGAYLNLYVDGVSAASPVAWANKPEYQATNYVRVGCANNSGTNILFFNGSLDEVALLNGTALSADEVAALYASRTAIILANATTPASSLMAIRFRQFFATHSDCVFQPTDSPYPVIYKPLLKNIPAFTARDDDIVNSGSEIAIGSLTLLNGKNADYSGGGPLDVCLQNYIYTRARCQCLIGGEDLPYSEYQTYWCGLVDTTVLQSAEVTLNIKDSLQALDYKYPTDTYQQSNNAEYNFSVGVLTTDGSGKGHTLEAIGDPVSYDDYSAILDIDDAYKLVSGESHADFCPEEPFVIEANVMFQTIESRDHVIFASYDLSGSVKAGWLLYVDYDGYVWFASYKNTGNVENTDWKQCRSGDHIIAGSSLWYRIICSWNGAYLQLWLTPDGYSTNTNGKVAWSYAPAYRDTNHVRIGCLATGAGAGTNATWSFMEGCISGVSLSKGLRGNSAMIGETIPTIYGKCYNIKPAETDTFTWLFQCASHPLFYLYEVREAGIDITENIGTLTLANAIFTLDDYADGRTITCDVTGKVSDADAIIPYGSVALDLLQAAPGITSDDIDSTAFTDFDTECTYMMGLYLTGEPLRETLSNMNKSVLARIIKGRDGKFRPKKFALPAVAAEYSFSTDTITDFSAQILQDKLYYKVRVGYEKNWCVQPDTAAGGVAVREDWTHTYKYVETENEDTKLKYACEDTLIVETLLIYKQEAELLAAEYLALLQQPWVEIEFTSSMVPYTLEIGDTISVDDGRLFGSTSRFIITAMVDDPATAKVTIAAKAPCDGTMNLI